MTKPNVCWLIAVALVAASWAAGVFLYPTLPARIPIHWNIRGQVDGYGSKDWAVFLMPAMMLGFLGLFKILPWLSPKNFEVDSNKSIYLFVVLTTIGLFVYLYAVTMYATWAHVAGKDKGLDMGRFLVGGIFLFLALLGQCDGQDPAEFLHGDQAPLDPRQRPGSGTTRTGSQPGPWSRAA